MVGAATGRHCRGDLTVHSMIGSITCSVASHKQFLEAQLSCCTAQPACGSPITPGWYSQSTTLDPMHLRSPHPFLGQNLRPHEGSPMFNSGPIPRHHDGHLIIHSKPSFYCKNSCLFMQGGSCEKPSLLICITCASPNFPWLSTERHCSYVACQNIVISIRSTMGVSNGCDKSNGGLQDRWLGASSLGFVLQNSRGPEVERCTSCSSWSRHVCDCSCRARLSGKDGKGSRRVSPMGSGVPGALIHSLSCNSRGKILLKIAKFHCIPVACTASRQITHSTGKPSPADVAAGNVQWLCTF